MVSITTNELNILLGRMRKGKVGTKPGADDATPDGQESRLHEEIMEECNRRGWQYVHSRMDKRSTTAKGVPDFIIQAAGGRVLWVEAKTRTGKVTAEQAGFARWAERLGHTVHVVRSRRAFLEVCDEQ